MNLLRLQNLYYRYPLAAQPACRSISMEIDTGRIIGLLGENGAGKSTLASLISGQLKPQKGNITGEALHKVGLVHQKPSKVSDMPVWKVILTGHPFRGKSWFFRPSREIKKLEALCDQWGLPLDLQRPYDELSQGEAQLAELLEILLYDPPVILLDEPDFSAPHILEKILSSLTQAGKGILLITHQMKEAETFCHHIYYMRQGVMVEQPLIEPILPDAQHHSLDYNKEAPLLDLSPLCRDRHRNMKVYRGEILVILGFRESGLEQLEHKLKEFLKEQEMPFAYVPSNSRSKAMDSTLSLAENISLCHGSYKTGWRNYKAELQHSMDFLEWGKWKVSPRDPLFTFSGGNQQKLVLLREAAQPHSLLLAVHPALGLDKSNHRAYLETLKKMEDKGVIYLSSDPRESVEIATRLAIYFGGKITQFLQPPYPEDEILQQMMMGAHR